MKNKKLVSIILAGGNSTRIKSKKSKVLLKIKNKTLLQTSICLAKNFSKKINIIINRSLIFLKEQNKSYSFFLQKNSLGTGHAVKEFFKHKRFSKRHLFMILYADTPFILKTDIKKMLIKIEHFDLVILGFKTNSNIGCGLIKKKNAKISEIIEYKNANKNEKKIKICNSGIMIFNHKIKKLIKLIKRNTLTREFYLTDIVKISKEKNLKIGEIVSISELRSRGINDIKTYKINKKYFENKKLNKKINYY